MVFRYGDVKGRNVREDSSEVDDENGEMVEVVDDEEQNERRDVSSIIVHKLEERPIES